jgi:hypothetical protein
VDPGAGVAAFVEQIVDEPRMAADRGALPRRLQIGFGGDRVLIVAEIVADISEELDQRHAEVGRMPFRPVRNEQSHSVHQELAEARIVLGEIV